jgi:cation:H+ antiporter
MAIAILMLLASLGLILLSCAVFVNAIEWFGKTLNLHQGVVGSILAAVGTALPETIIPIIAILFTKGNSGHAIGIGAIAGAPFMLGTLGFFVTGAAVIANRLLKRRTLTMAVDRTILSRDLLFFLTCYGIAVSATFYHDIHALKWSVAVCLAASYALYLKMTIHGKAAGIDIVEPLYATRFFKLTTSLFWITLQLAAGLGCIVWGAHLFINHVGLLSKELGFSPLLLSLIITPIATELPEKLNSVIWVGRKKDTLALGNITGAMVFQSCFPVTFGMIFTEWNLRGPTLVSAACALGMASITLIGVRIAKSLSPFLLLGGGVLYAVFLCAVFLR